MLLQRKKKKKQKTITTVHRQKAVNKSTFLISNYRDLKRAAAKKQMPTLCLLCTSNSDLFLAVREKKIHGISLEMFPTMYEIKQLEPEQAAHTKSP